MEKYNNWQTGKPRRLHPRNYQIKTKKYLKIYTESRTFLIKRCQQGYEITDSNDIMHYQYNAVCKITKSIKHGQIKV